MGFPSPSEKQARIIWLALTGAALALLIGLVGALILALKWVLQVLGPVLWPLAVAGVAAYLLDPVVDFLERRRVPRQRAIILVFAAALLLVTGLFGSVVPQVITETRDLASRIPAYVNRTQARMEDWINHPPAIVLKLLKREGEPRPTAPGLPPASGTNAMEFTNTVPVTPSPTNAVESSTLASSLDAQTLQTATGLITRFAPRVGSWLADQATRVASWFGVLAGLALIPVYAFYLLLEKKGIQSSWADYLPVSNSSFKDELVFVIGSINDYMIAFFRGQVLVAICDGILYTIGFLVIGLPYAVLLGVVATFLTMIPFLGAIITCVAALLIAAVQFGDWQHPALVLGVFAIVQALEGLVISPKIMGDRVGLHPVTIIIAVMAGTTLLGGILGGILAIPLTAVLRVLLSRYVWKRTQPSPAQPVDV